MKKYAILFSLLIVFGLSHAQTGKRNSAFNFMKSGNLPKAKAAIDEAIEHTKTKNDPKTWLYKGEIYLEIGRSPLADLVKISNEDAAKLGYEALLKAQELDTENELAEDIKIYLGIAGEVYFNVAVAKYNEKNYLTAGEYFDQSFMISEGNGRIDTLALFNGAMAYYKAENFDKSLVNYAKLADMNYESPTVYYSYTDLLKISGDTAKAQQVVEKGRQIYPTDFNLILAETNIFLETDQTERALGNLRLAIELDPSNFSVHYAVATQYDRIFNNDEFTDEERLSAFDESELAYLKAIELKANYFDAIYNLGALYFNKGVFYLTKADALPYGDKGYEPFKEKGDGFLNKALPYLEQALSLNGEDYNTLFSLKQIYSRTGQAEKYKAVNDKLAEIGEPDAE